LDKYGVWQLTPSTHHFIKLDEKPSMHNCLQDRWKLVLSGRKNKRYENKSKFLGLIDQFIVVFVIALEKVKAKKR